MSPALVLVVLFVVALGGILALGVARITLPRHPGLEGIEEPQAAQAYDRISRSPQFALLRRMIAARLATHHPAGLLADLGCGPGRLATLIARQHPHLRVIGIDTSSEMIRAARENAANLGLVDRLTFREGDLTEIPLLNSSLDFALSTLSLHHWSEPGKVLTEIHRVLRPGAQLLIFDLRRDARRFFYWLMRFATAVVVPSGLRRAGEPLGSLLASYTLGEMGGLLARSPFQEWRLDGGAAWTFIWARRSDEEASGGQG